MEYVRVPSFAENVEAVTIRQWLVEDGSVVEQGDEIVALLTEKADFNFESPCVGRVSAMLFPERSTVPVGAVLCVMDGTEDDIQKAREENDRLAQTMGGSSVLSTNAALGNVSVAVNPAPVAKVRATPAARRLAKENGIALVDIAVTSGPMVREEDVRAFLDR